MPVLSNVCERRVPSYLVFSLYFYLHRKLTPTIKGKQIFLNGHFPVEMSHPAGQVEVVSRRTRTIQTLTLVGLRRALE